jgi:hypothetical protein
MQFNFPCVNRVAKAASEEFSARGKWLLITCATLQHNAQHGDGVWPTNHKKKQLAEKESESE